MRKLIYLLLVPLVLTTQAWAQDASPEVPASTEETATDEQLAEVPSAEAPAVDETLSAEDTEEVSAEGNGEEAVDETAEVVAETEPEAQEAAPEASEEAVTTQDSGALPSENAPSDTERLVVSSVAGVLALAGLTAGIISGVMAMNQYQCLEDVTACNKDLDEPIEDSDYTTAIEDVERLSLYADMGYLVAATATIVSVVGFVELWMGGEEAGQ